MTHLGGRVTLLVDGRLAPDAADRALAHASQCPDCAAALAIERRVRDALRARPDPAPSEELVTGLVALGGPQGPLGPRPGHVPGTVRPAPLPPPGRLAQTAGPWEIRVPRGRRDPTGPGGARRRGRRARVASVAVGALSLAFVGLLGLVALGSWFPAGRVAPGAAELALASGGGSRLDGAALNRLRQDGWPCPPSLPDGLRLVSARSIAVDGEPAIHLRYSDGRSAVSVVEQRGRLDVGQVPVVRAAELSGVPVLQRQDGSWHGVWQSGDLVLAVVADAPPDVVRDVVAALPHERPDGGWWTRVDDGADVLGSLLARR